MTARIAQSMLRAFYRRIEPHRAPPRWATYLVVAECDRGDLWLPDVDGLNRVTGWWGRPLCWRNPAHWPYVALTFATGWIVMVES